MFLLHGYEKFLQKIVSIIEIVAYSFSVIIITISIFVSIFIYIMEYKNPEKSFVDTRINLGEAISLALSFILSVEILKIFYIKTYKQLIIVASVTLLKLTINKYLLQEINDALKNKQMFFHNS
jgi:uncharacterized membrane protein